MWELRTGAGELAAGDRIGPFRLEALLGSGGMGVVYRAVREDDGGVVALKVLREELSGDEVFRRRFAHEARSAAEVHHPNLVGVLETGESNGRFYLATALVSGRPLEAWIRMDGGLPLAAAINLVSEIGSALDALHGAGIVHRDVKASNVLVEQDGTALLTDFGLAKGAAYTALTRPGQVMGTLDYLAPEVIRGEEATPASDVYALGCLAYECVTGGTPFGDRSLFQIGLAHLDEEPPDPLLKRPDCPPRLGSALLHALAKDAADRPVSAGAYARGLAAAHP
jgi:serine/threonine protein kinase